eukprot:5536048-Amphidinium_carterae.1
MANDGHTGSGGPTMGSGMLGQDGSFWAVLGYLLSLHLVPELPRVGDHSKADHCNDTEAVGLGAVGAGIHHRGGLGTKTLGHCRFHRQIPSFGKCCYISLSVPPFENHL